MKTLNLYGEDGIAIYVNNFGDLCNAEDASVKIIGRTLYACSIEEAHQKILSEYEYMRTEN